MASPLRLAGGSDGLVHRPGSPAWHSHAQKCELLLPFRSHPHSKKGWVLSVTSDFEHLFKVCSIMI